MESRGETVLVENVHLLKTRFLLAIAEMANSAQPGDTLVIVICGHSAETWNGDIIIGGETEDVPLQKDEVAVALRRIVIPPERLFVVSTACFLGQWGSDLWTFLAATDSATSRRTKQVSDYPALEPEEKAELFRLATEYDKRPHGSSASEVPVNAKSRKVAANHPIAPRDERVLLTRLRYRDHECRRASRIAEFLGWTPARPVEDWCHSNGLREMKEAEEAGAAIATEFFLGAEVGARVGRQRVWKTMVPGAWLANAWINTGRPIVTASRWKEATDYADSETDVQRP
ncbi:hypothetical protein FB451DRAFT_1317049 [Mycena latifolia]|nr:hypothetical protein FB451DRAFT_1317049 [Mycena latifolia]